MHIIMETTMTTNTAMHTITHTAMPKGRYGVPACP